MNEDADEYRISIRMPQERARLVEKARGVTSEEPRKLEKNWAVKAIQEKLIRNGRITE